MDRTFVRPLTVLLVGLLALPTAGAVYASPQGHPSANLGQEAYALMRAGEYRAAAIVLAEIGQMDLASGDQELGQAYLALSQAVGSLASVNVPAGRSDATSAFRAQNFFDCLAALAELSAAEITFDAACVTPAVVIVATCVAAILVLSAASYNVGSKCG